MTYTCSVELSNNLLKDISSSLLGKVAILYSVLEQSGMVIAVNDNRLFQDRDRRLDNTDRPQITSLSSQIVNNAEQIAKCIIISLLSVK